ncbi:MAG: hypothetical protein WB797_17730, partial [Nocardioides sp.]
MRGLPDLRMIVLAGAGWLGALSGAGHHLAVSVVTGICTVGAVSAFGRWRGASAVASGAAAIVVFASVATASGVRAERVSDNPLTQLADRRAEATLWGVVTDDPRPIQGRFGDEVLVRLTVTRATTGDTAYSLREPVLVFGSPPWLSVPLGSTVQLTGHLTPSTQGDVAAVVSTSASPDVRAGPDPWWRASGRLRAALRASVSGLPPDRRTLV